MPEVVVIHGGPRKGRSLGNEAAFRAAIAEGKKVYTYLNGIWFVVQVDLMDVISYSPCAEKKPDDLPDAHQHALNRPFVRIT